MSDDYITQIFILVIHVVFKNWNTTWYNKFVKGLSQSKIHGKYYLATKMRKMGFETEPSYQLGSWQFNRVDIYRGVNKDKGPKSDLKAPKNSKSWKTLLPLTRRCKQTEGASEAGAQDEESRFWTGSHGRRSATSRTLAKKRKGLELIPWLPFSSSSRPCLSLEESTGKVSHLIQILKTSLPGHAVVLGWRVARGT